MFCQILTSKNSWLYNNKTKFLDNFIKFKKIKIINNCKLISKQAHVIFVISYYKIIPLTNLKKNNNIFVIHDSDLPKGRGMSPLFNQILNRKKKIVTTIFKCEKNIDDGKIVLKKTFNYPDTLIYDEIKSLQMKNNIFMIKNFINYFNQKKIKLKDQKGKPTYFSKISEKKNNINKKKSIISQFDRIRTRDNKYFRAYFVHKNRKYFIKIEPEKSKI